MLRNLGRFLLFGNETGYWDISFLIEMHRPAFGSCFRIYQCGEHTIVNEIGGTWGAMTL